MHAPPEPLRAPRRAAHPLRIGARVLVAALAAWACASPPGGGGETKADAIAQYEARADAWFAHIRDARIALEEDRLADAKSSARDAAALSLEFDEEHPQQLASLETLQLILQQALVEREAEDAWVWLEEIARVAEARSPPRRRLELEMWGLQGQLALETGQPDRAITPLVRMRARALSAFGPVDPYSINATTSLARARLGIGQPAKALSLTTGALRDAEEQLGTDDPRTATVLAEHARIQWGAGQRHASNESLEQALELRRSYYGEPTEPDLRILDSLVQHAFVLFDYPRAERYAEDAVALYDQAYRGPTLGALQHLTVLAHVDNRRGRYDQARAHAEEALEAARGIFGDASEPVARLLALVGSIDYDAERYELAGEEFERAIEATDAAFGEPHPESGVFVRLAEVESRIGDPERAEAMFREALGAARQTFGRTGLPTAAHEARLAMFLERAERPGEAWAMLVPAIERMLGQRPADELLVDAMRCRARLAVALDHLQARVFVDEAYEVGLLVFGQESSRLEALGAERLSLLGRTNDRSAAPPPRRSPMREVLVSEDLGLRYELPGRPWQKVAPEELEFGILLALVRHSPKITFTLGAQPIDAGVRQQLGLAPDAPVETSRAASLFQEQLDAQQEELISRTDRIVGGVPGIEFLYEADRTNGAFYHATWLAIHDGVLYELKSWSRTGRVSRTRLLRQFRQLQERLEWVPSEGEVP